MDSHSVFLMTAETRAAGLPTRRVDDRIKRKCAGLHMQTDLREGDSATAAYRTLHICTP